jgi:hypothetical protein
VCLANCRGVLGFGGLVFEVLIVNSRNYDVVCGAYKYIFIYLYVCGREVMELSIKRRFFIHSQ